LPPPPPLFLAHSWPARDQRVLKSLKHTKGKEVCPILWFYEESLGPASKLPRKVLDCLLPIASSGNISIPVPKTTSMKHSVLSTVCLMHADETIHQKSVSSHTEWHAKHTGPTRSVTNPPLVLGGMYLYRLGRSMCVLSEITFSLENEVTGAWGLAESVWNIYIHTYTCTYTYIYTYIYIYIHTHIYIYIHRCLGAHLADSVWNLCLDSIAAQLSAYVSIRQHTSAYVCWRVKSMPWFDSGPTVSTHGIN
jgi:hypothetical protein